MNVQILAKRALSLPIDGADVQVRAGGQHTLGSAVRARRRRLGLRQSELADLAEVSARFVHALETDKATVQLDKVLDVLTALGLHLELRRGASAVITADSVETPLGSP